MGNQIAEHYFNEDFIALHKQRLDSIFHDIVEKTGFQFEKVLKKKTIYTKDKIQCVEMKGKLQDQPVILVIQGLKLETEEFELMRRFEEQNKSKIVRTPKVLTTSAWNNEKQYSYFIMEYIDAPPIYAGPLATEDEIQDFLKFYKEYRKNCLIKTFVDILPREESALVFTSARVMHWAKICESQGNLTSEKIKLLEQYLTVIGKYLPNVSMEFCHGHLDANSVRKMSNGEYILMSNIFWTWRPQMYDMVFHLWAGIKSLRDEVTEKLIVKYLFSWEDGFIKIQDKKYELFAINFRLMMLERCIGTILVDIENQEYPKHESGKDVEYLRELFISLFKLYSHSCDVLSKSMYR